MVPFDRMLPDYQAWVAQLGTLPAGSLTLAGLLALWMACRLLAPFVIVLPGLLAGAGVVWWLGTWHSWHPLFAALAGLAVAAGLFQLFANVFAARCAFAAIAAPLATVALWHLAAGAFPWAWALAITGVGVVSLGSLAQRFVLTENRALRFWLADLIEELRGA